MKIRKLFLCALAIFAVSACQEGNANKQKAASASPQTNPGISESSWLPPLNGPLAVFPPRTKGSPYTELFTELFSLSQPKGEFETTAEYRDRIAKIPGKIASKYGRVFVFRNNGGALAIWDADQESLRIRHVGNEDESEETRVPIGLEEFREADLHRAFFILQGCGTTVIRGLTSEQAKTIKDGIANKEIGVFYTGSIDFSERGWTAGKILPKFELSPGFHWFNVPWIDFDVRKIDIVEVSSGTVLSSVDCV